ncbi:MAG: aldo/keto reductase [Clostridia bacterium]|nr:aldo/keto reductase [Clostridia bacterium]
MQKVKLNRTDLTVSEVCLGTADFGTKLDREAAFAQLDAFTASGGNFVDTANVYSRDWAADISRSEEILGQYRKARPGVELIIATKGAHPNPSTMHTSRISREALTHDIDESLRTLGLDCIDFYWLHRDNPAMPVSEILGLMEEFVKAGKIRYYGGSNYTLRRLIEADACAKADGMQGFSAVSNMWSPAVQNEGFPLSGDDTLVCFDDSDVQGLASLGMAFIPYSSTAKGWFSKRAAGIAGEKLNAVYENAANLALLEKLMAENVPVQTALLRYMRRFGESHGVQLLPITACSGMAQLDEVLRV